MDRLDTVILGHHDLENGIVSVSITTEFPSFVKSVLNQLNEKRFSFVTDIIPIAEESKVFVRVPINQIHKLATLYRVERIFLNLYSVPLTEGHPLLTPDVASYESFLNEMHTKIDLNNISDAWSAINGGKRPIKWTALIRRVGGKTTALQRNLNKLAFQELFRTTMDSIWSDETLRCGRKIILPSRKEDREVAFQVFCRMVPTRVTVGIPLYTRRVKKQFVFAHKGLHHSCCWGLARLANLKTGDVCVDLMCGKASILCEAADFYPYVTFIGSDISSSQIKDACANVRINHPESTDLLLSDGTASALRPGLADVVIADLPFGKQIGNVQENRLLYPAFQKELARVLSKDGRAVVMTSRQCGGLVLPTRRSIEGSEGVTDSLEMPLHYGRIGEGQGAPQIVAAVPLILGAIDCVAFLIAGENVKLKLDRGEKQLGEVFGIDEEGIVALDLETWFKGEDVEGGDKWSRVNFKQVKPTLVPFLQRDVE